MCDSAQSLRREALTGMTVVEYETPLPELLESAYEAVRSFNHRTSGGAMIAPEAYRILGETMAFADVFRQALGQFANGLRPHERTAVLLRTLWAYRGLGGDLTRTAAAHAVNRSTARYRLHHIRELKEAPAATSAAPEIRHLNCLHWRVWQRSQALAFIQRNTGDRHCGHSPTRRRQAGR